ncbi:hypothetical protein PR048_030546 [Dryococelus australis]|uniref:Tc1-like transposase DDE domain-containing protein n=1 Tax=Dryococelus australis TaxID=614101 RepID=A0ABQ9G996_9NEOP|nr:hypothetical protein PR048_030546 [Dryococelus australis]
MPGRPCTSEILRACAGNGSAPRKPSRPTATSATFPACENQGRPSAGNRNLYRPGREARSLDRYAPARPPTPASSPKTDCLKLSRALPLQVKRGAHRDPEPTWRSRRNRRKWWAGPRSISRGFPRETPATGDPVTLREDVVVVGWGEGVDQGGDRHVQGTLTQRSPPHGQSSPLCSPAEAILGTCTVKKQFQPDPPPPRPHKPSLLDGTMDNSSAGGSSSCDSRATPSHVPQQFDSRVYHMLAQVFLFVPVDSEMIPQLGIYLCMDVTNGEELLETTLGLATSSWVPDIVQSDAVPHKQLNYFNLECFIIVFSLALNLVKRIAAGINQIPCGVAPGIFARGDRAGRCCCSAGHLRDIPFTSSSHSGAAPYPLRFTLIGSQDLVVKPHLTLHSIPQFNAELVSYLILIPRFGTKIDESKIHNHEISLVQHFYTGTKIGLDPGSELGSFDLGSGKMSVQPASTQEQLACGADRPIASCGTGVRPPGHQSPSPNDQCNPAGPRVFLALFAAPRGVRASIAPALAGFNALHLPRIYSAALNCRPSDCLQSNLPRPKPQPAVTVTSVDLWITAFGVGPLVFVRGSMNTEANYSILDNEILPTLWRFYGMDPCYFQDDNARCHVSRATMQWYADNNVRQLDWPVQSPDLNPIEHLWDELDRRVRTRQARPKSIAQLVEWLQEEWRRIPVDVLKTLVESMPDRVAAVIAARGEIGAAPEILLCSGQTNTYALFVRGALNLMFQFHRKLVAPFHVVPSSERGNYNAINTLKCACMNATSVYTQLLGMLFARFPFPSTHVQSYKPVSREAVVKEPMRVIEVSMKWRRNERAGGERGDPRENPPTSGIVRHDSHFALVGGEQANRSANAALQTMKTHAQCTAKFFFCNFAEKLFVILQMLVTVGPQRFLFLNYKGRICSRTLYHIDSCPRLRAATKWRTLYQQPKKKKTVERKKPGTQEFQRKDCDTISSAGGRELGPRTVLPDEGKASFASEGGGEKANSGTEGERQTAAKHRWLASLASTPEPDYKTNTWQHSIPRSAAFMAAAFCQVQAARTVAGNTYLRRRYVYISYHDCLTLSAHQQETEMLIIDPLPSPRIYQIHHFVGRKSWQSRTPKYPERTQLRAGHTPRILLEDLCLPIAATKDDVSGRSPMAAYVCPRIMDVQYRSTLLRLVQLSENMSSHVDERSITKGSCGYTHGMLKSSMAINIFAKYTCPYQSRVYNDVTKAGSKLAAATVQGQLALLKPFHGKVSTFKTNLRKKSLHRPTRMRPVKLVTMDANRPRHSPSVNAALTTISTSPFSITPNFSEALLKFYFQDIPPPHAKKKCRPCPNSGIPGVGPAETRDESSKMMQAGSKPRVRRGHTLWSCHRRPAAVDRAGEVRRAMVSGACIQSEGCRRTKMALDGWRKSVGSSCYVPPPPIPAPFPRPERIFGDLEDCLHRLSTPSPIKLLPDPSPEHIFVQLVGDCPPAWLPLETPSWNFPKVLTC